MAASRPSSALGAAAGPARERERDTPTTRPGAVRNDAENLEEDDDICSWALVDQMGAAEKDKGLGVYPQQVKFVGPPHKSDEVLGVVQNARPDIPAALQQLFELPVFKAHADAKATAEQVTRFKKHMRRYLLIYEPSSRVEIHTTARYTHHTGHTELAVYATRALQPGDELNELQGTMVDLPKEWEQDIDVADRFDAGSDSEGGEAGEAGDDDEDEEDGAGSDALPGPSRKGKARAELRGVRRSGRTRRRTFSIIYSNSKKRTQLFLGPARFLNHDCNPNVELLRKGTYVTFRVLDRPIRIGDELTTMYAPNYFGEGNRECLCLTCEQNGVGGFAATASDSRSRSRSISTTPLVDSPGPSRLGARSMSSLRLSNLPDEPDDIDDADSEAVSRSRAGSLEPEEPQRERHVRRAQLNAKPLVWLSRKKRASLVAAEAFTPEPEFDDAHDDCSPDQRRCTTCCRPFDPIWINNRYLEHCVRCIRHTRIFLLPWPAHRAQDIANYPPTHLIPRGYLPRKILSVPLPTLEKVPRPAPRLVASARATPDPAEERLPLPPRGAKWNERGRDDAEVDVLLLDSKLDALVDELERDAQRLAAKALRDAKRREEREAATIARRKRDAAKVRGSGLWHKYEYLTNEEFARREAAKHVITSGTRRGGRFRAAEDEAEMRTQAEEARRLQVAREAAETAAHEDEEEEEADAGEGPRPGGEDIPQQAAEPEHVAVDDKAAAQKLEAQPASDGRKAFDAIGMPIGSSSAASFDTPRRPTATEAAAGPSSSGRTQSHRISLPAHVKVFELDDDDSDDGGAAAGPVRRHTHGSGTKYDAFTFDSDSTSAASAETGASAFSAGSKRGRGRPPGTGKLQKRREHAAKLEAAREADRQRRQETRASQDAPTPRAAATPSRPGKAGALPVMDALDGSDGDDSDDGILCTYALEGNEIKWMGQSPQKATSNTTAQDAGRELPQQSRDRAPARPAGARMMRVMRCDFVLGPDHRAGPTSVRAPRPDADAASLGDASPPATSAGTSGSAERDSIDDVERTPLAGASRAPSKRPRASQTPEKSPTDHKAKRASIFASARPNALPNVWRG